MHIEYGEKICYGLGDEPEPEDRGEKREDVLPRFTPANQASHCKDLAALKENWISDNMYPSICPLPLLDKSISLPMFLVATNALLGLLVFLSQDFAFQIKWGGLHTEDNQTHQRIVSFRFWR